MIQILLAQIPEAIFFSIFMIFSKELKEKRILFTFLMTATYLILKIFIHYSIWFHILYIFDMFMILKLLYKEKAQITDIFTFGIVSIFLMITSAISYLIYKYKFIEKLTFNQISARLNDMKNARIAEKLDQIALAIRIHCGI